MYPIEFKYFFSAQKTHQLSFIGCLLAITLEIYFEERIFIPHSGGVSFGLIVLLVINMVTI
ncbi:hypothetical protein MJN51_37385, partial [Salmonella enterica subsp. enterica serovar Kentucky]|nr:hypothetical protein [Salmonella enterica subsp. enterica serovar Kentucky]